MSEEIIEQAAEKTEEELGHFHNYSAEDAYVVPKEALIRERLEWFRDQKLGLMMHWGPYSQIGIMESWGVCDEDWTYSSNDWQADREDMKREYFDLNKTFNPIRFQPDQWAQLAADSGFKYLIFTTKHHDGFCMWDSQYTDYKVTNPDCPYHANKNADICKNLFESFRKKGLAIAAYFSKADWTTPYYWADGFSKPVEHGRNPSYDVEKYPWLWDQFVDFTRNQILELLTKYGRIDILWLDAGWVCKANGQDIKLGEIVDEARKTQPWLLSSDRTVGGEYENYITPEQTIPPLPISVPWESCITLGNSFSYCYDDCYKSAREVIRILVDIVAKGGNLALNVGPQPDGRLPKNAIKTLTEMGEWLKVNGEAIYGTRVAAPYRLGDFGFTKKGDAVYAIRLFECGAAVEKEQTIPYTEKVDCIHLLGQEAALHFEVVSSGIKVILPDSVLGGDTPVALTFKMQ